MHINTLHSNLLNDILLKDRNERAHSWDVDCNLQKRNHTRGEMQILLKLHSLFLVKIEYLSERLLVLVVLARFEVLCHQTVILCSLPLESELAPFDIWREITLKRKFKVNEGSHYVRRSML